MLLVYFVDRADVRMIQCRRRLGFALEAAESVLVFSNFIRQELERDKATKFDILGLVHHTHPATAELLDDAIVRDGLADHWRESYVYKTGKSMKAAELVGPQKDCWRKIPITLIDEVVSPLDGRAYRARSDQLTRVITHVPACFRKIHRWLPRACLGVEPSAEENVVL